MGYYENYLAKKQAISGNTSGTNVKAPTNDAYNTYLAKKALVVPAKVPVITQQTNQPVTEQKLPDLSGMMGNVGVGEVKPITPIQANATPKQEKIMTEISKFGARTAIGLADITSESLDYITDYAANNLIDKKKPQFKTITDLNDKWTNFYNEQAKKGNIPTKKFKNYIDTLQNSNFIKSSPEWEKSSIKEKFTKKLGETILNIGPSILSSAIPYIINPGLGFIMSSASTANDVKDSAIQYGVDQDKAEKLGLATGLVVGALDKIVPDKTLTKDVKKKFLGGFIKRFVKTVLTETGTEMAQENIQLLAEKTFRDDLGWDEVKTRNAIAGLGGLLGGSGFSILENFSNNTIKKDILNETDLKLELIDSNGAKTGQIVTSPTSETKIVGQLTSGGTIKITTPDIAPGTYNPDQVIGKVSESPLKNTELGNSIIKASILAKQTNKNVIISGTEEALKAPEITKKEEVVLTPQEQQKKIAEMKKEVLKGKEVGPNGETAKKVEEKKPLTETEIKTFAEIAQRTSTVKSFINWIGPDGYKRIRDSGLKVINFYNENNNKNVLNKSQNITDKDIDLTEGDIVLYNGEKYKFIKNYGINGDRRIIEDSFGNQTPVLPNQITKVSNAEGIEKYGMSHRPTETGATADNITQEVSDMGLPNDFYQHPEYYSNMDDKSYQESFNVLKKIKGNPEAEITIYRASPKNELNKGDWVTLSKNYAKGESLSEGTPVNSFKVKAKDIQFAGDDINEFGYYPKSETFTKKIVNEEKIQKKKTVSEKVRTAKNITEVKSALKSVKKRISDLSFESEALTEVAKEKRSGLNTKDIAQLKRIYNRNQKFQEGDIETIRDSKWQPLVDRVIEDVQIKRPDLSEEDAFAYAMNLPTKAEETIIKSEELKKILDRQKILNGYLDKLEAKSKELTGKEKIERGDELYEEWKSVMDSQEKLNKIITAKERVAAAQKPIEETKGEEKLSKVAQRVLDKLIDVQQSDITYKPMSIVEDAAKATEFVEQNPETAQRIAKGLELPPPDITETAISIAAAQKALDDNDYLLYTRLILSRTFRQTRRGQEIVAERGRMDENSSEFFIRKLLDERAKLAAKGKKWIFEKEVNVQKVIAKEVKKIKETIDSKVLKKLESAQKLIDSLTCKI